jgi:HlyD family secretion protein
MNQAEPSGMPQDGAGKRIFASQNLTTKGAFTARRDNDHFFRALREAGGHAAVAPLSEAWRDEGLRMVIRGRNAMLVGAIVLLIGGVAAKQYGFALREWLGLSGKPDFLIVSGNIEAHQSVVSFKTVQSRIIDLPFDEGQWVKAGALLAKVDSSDYAQQVKIGEASLSVQQRQHSVSKQNLEAAGRTVASDEADLELKQLEFNRAQTLMTKGSGTVQARDLARAALKESVAALARDKALLAAAERNVSLAEANIVSAEATLGMAQIVLGYTILAAPFDGVILVRQAELGEIAVPGAPIVTLADIDHVWLRAYVNETDIGKVRYGQPATVTTDTYPGKQYSGRISFISSSAEFTPKTVETHAERVSLVYRIKIDIDNPMHELVLGMPADARIQLLPPGPP